MTVQSRPAGSNDLDEQGGIRQRHPREHTESPESRSWTTELGNGKKMGKEALAGVIAAIVTPVGADGRPDHERFTYHAKWLLDNGCDALNVLGTTGEATSFSAEARRELMLHAAKTLPTERLMVGTGCPDLQTTASLTAHAAKCGFAAALVLPPFYYKGVSDAGLFSYFSELVAATQDTMIPIYLYNFPAMTGLVFSPDVARELHDTFPHRIMGAKDSSGDLDYARKLASIDGFAVFPSDESTLAEAKASGFVGCISATVNLSAPIAAQLLKQPEDSGLQQQVKLLRAAISALPLIPAVKCMVGRLHSDTLFEGLRSPLMPLSKEEQERLPDFPRDRA